MRRLFAGLLAALLGCSMTRSNGEKVETESKPTEKTEPPAEKPAEKAPRPERKMTDQAKAAMEKLADSQASEPERIKAARQLAELEDPASVTPMLAVLEVELSDALSGEIYKALDLIGATKVLLEDLTQADEVGRATAAKLLPRLKDRAAINPLMGALSDPAPKVRESAAGSLGILGAKEAEPALIERLEKDPDADVRGAAAQALGAFHTETGRAALKKALAAEKDDFVKVLIEQGLR